jgi:hypothetical protein
MESINVPPQPFEVDSAQIYVDEPLEGEIILSHQRQKLFTSLTEMLSYIKAFQIQQASFHTGYVQDDVGFVKSDKVFILNYVSMGD